MTGSFYSGLFRRDHNVQVCCGGTIVVDIIVFRIIMDIILLTICGRVLVFLYQLLTVVHVIIFLCETSRGRVLKFLYQHVNERYHDHSVKDNV